MALGPIKYVHDSENGSQNLKWEYPGSYNKILPTRYSHWRGGQDPPGPPLLPRNTTGTPRVPVVNQGIPPSGGWTGTHEHFLREVCSVSQPIENGLCTGRDRVQADKYEVLSVNVLAE